MLIGSKSGRFRDLLGMLSTGRYVSGEQVSRALGISREAVWKHVSALRRYGYIVEAKPRLGYMLITRPDRLYPWEIMLALGGSSMVKEIIYYDEVDSTQDVALRLAEQGNDSTLVIAERQSRGRGRSHRLWVSPAGGVWFSLITKPRIDVRRITLLSLATALAICSTISTNCRLDARIKWPNDVVIGMRKVAGILIDTSVEHDVINYAVIGIGVNANVSVSSIESMMGDEDRGYHYYGSTSLMDETGRAVDRVGFTASLLKALEDVYSRLEHGADLLTAVRAKMLFGPVSLITGEDGGGVRTRDCMAVDLDDDGSLLVEIDGRIERISSASVHVRHRST